MRRRGRASKMLAPPWGGGGAWWWAGKRFALPWGWHRFVLAGKQDACPTLGGGGGGGEVGFGGELEDVLVGAEGLAGFVEEVGEVGLIGAVFFVDE